MADTLVLLRHGQSQANAEGLFTGLLDVSLTDVGQMEAAYAAELLNEAEIWPTVWFSSPLKRAADTTAIMHDKMFHSPSRVTYDWRLAERNYGALTSRSKRDVMAEHGEEQFLTWRRSMNVAPPPMSRAQQRSLGRIPEDMGRTEALTDVIERVSESYEQLILPELRRTGCVLVSSHGNALRALCTLLDELTDTEVRALNLPTGQPLIYEITEDGRPVVRGGTYLDPERAYPAAEQIAREGGT